MSWNTVIPFCRTDFLQDLSIEVGLRFATYHPWNHLYAETGKYTEDEEEFEMLTVWAQLYLGVGVWLNLIAYEDRAIRICASSWFPEDVCEYAVGFYIPFLEFDAAQIAEAFRDSACAASRLYYEECPLPILRRIWRYTGPVEIEGQLRSANR